MIIQNITFYGEHHETKNQSVVSGLSCGRLFIRMSETAAGLPGIRNRNKRNASPGVSQSDRLGGGRGRSASLSDL